MLVRDINVNAAIIDLVDNSVDGAIRLLEEKHRDKKDNEKKANFNFKGLWVKIEADRVHFLIRDNCGGIPIDLARHYAFNFGRSPRAPPLPYSVGQFGVGMKRALFKLGSKFKIDSTSKDSRFIVDVDVAEWSRNDVWRFLISTPPPTKKRGTTITVRPLNENVATHFAFPVNVNNLSVEIGERHQINIERGLRINVNEQRVVPRPARLLSSKQLKPAYSSSKLQAKNGSTVAVEMWAGLGRDKRLDAQYAGWYVFCNGRMILRADRRKITGWGDRDEIVIPSYHNQFRMFRGYVTFDSKDGSVLPWTTTKTDVDEQSWIYPSIKLQMLTLMRPVIDFLNDAERETRAGREETGPLHMAIKRAKLLTLNKLKDSDKFVAPPASEVSKMGTISYKKPASKIELAKQMLNVRLNKEVGEKTFDYFMKLERD
jgi:hypothetical protein